MSAELEIKHYWLSCEKQWCYYCLWWDLCWALADVGIRVEGPKQW